MFQSFKLSEYVIVYGASLTTVLELFIYFCLSSMPIILPTGLLFSILLVYGRLSQDSEVVAMKALGLHPFYFSLPGFILGSLVFLISLQISFNIAPWGNRQRDNIVHKLTQNRPAVNIREGVFSEGFFDLVVYANDVDESKGRLKNVFIYDERNPKSPMTIIAKSGEVLTEQTEEGNRAFLRLLDGNMHRTSLDFYTKIDFKSYDINLFDPAEFTTRKLDTASLGMSALRRRLNHQNSSLKEQKEAQLEWYKRFTLPVACLVFSLIGIVLGTVTNRRSAKSSGMVLCITTVILYWMIYAGFETLGKEEKIPMILAVWLPNLLFIAFGLFRWKRLLHY